MSLHIYQYKMSLHIYQCKTIRLATQRILMYIINIGTSMFTLFQLSLYIKSDRFFFLHIVTYFMNHYFYMNIYNNVKSLWKRKQIVVRHFCCKPAVTAFSLRDIRHGIFFFFWFTTTCTLTSFLGKNKVPYQAILRDIRVCNFLYNLLKLLKFISNPRRAQRGELLNMIFETNFG